jgi:peptide/nickel transport system permease protein
MAIVLMRRVTLAAITLLLASLLVFFVARIAGSPADTMLSSDAGPEERAAYIERMGLDQPILVQYARWLGAAITGDFGNSTRTGRPVIGLVGTRLVNSLLLTTVAMLIAVGISIPLGVQAAVHRGTIWDRAAMTVALLGQSMPSFLSAILAILIFAVTLRWLPTGGSGGWVFYVLPGATLGWFMSAGMVRLVRSNMLDILGSEYVKLARMKGLGEFTVVWKHAVRNALIPVVAYFAFSYGIMLGASMAVEVVFNFPGLGRLAYEATISRDFPLLQLTVLTWALVIIAINFAADIIYIWIDPRIRL